MAEQKTYSDEYYVKKAQEGNQEALEYLFKKYRSLAFYIALKICHCDADAEDIVQESFIEIGRSIANLKEPKYFKAWLNKVVFSKSTKLFRKNKDINVSGNDYVMMSQSQEDRRYLLPKEEMNFQNDRDILLHFLTCLPDKLRTSLYLMYFEQLSVKEISFILDIPEGTVKSRVSSAKAELKAMISQYERRENVKLDFHSTTLEAALAIALLQEFSLFEQAMMKPKLNTLRWKQTIKQIPPMALAMICVAIISVSALVGSLFMPDHSISKQDENGSAVVEQSYHTFEPVMFQGKKIMTAREAYEALTDTAHCYVEAEAVEEPLREEMKKVYESLKKTGGIYYEMICRRQYEKIFE